MNPVITRIAHAIYLADKGTDYAVLYPWDGQDEETTQAHYIRMAYAALIAMMPSSVWEPT